MWNVCIPSSEGVMLDSSISQIEGGINGQFRPRCSGHASQADTRTDLSSCLFSEIRPRSDAAEIDRSTAESNSADVLLVSPERDAHTTHT